MTSSADTLVDTLRLFVDEIRVPQKLQIADFTSPIRYRR